MSDHLGPFIAIQEALGEDKAKARRMIDERLDVLDREAGMHLAPLVDLLISRGVVSLEELTPATRRLLAERHSLRQLKKVTT